MWTMLSRLSLGLGLIAAAAAVLLFSDWQSRRVREEARRVLEVAILQHASQAILDQGVEGMIAGMKEQGFEAGQEIRIRRYNAEGDTATSNAIAKEITGGKFDLVLTATTPSLQAVAQANRGGNVNHVFGLVTDPVAAGVGIGQDPLDHPRHLVGYGTKQPVAGAFRLARQMFPGLKRVGVAWNPAESNSEANTKMARAICKDLGIELLEANVENSSGVAEATASLTSRGAQALWVGGDVTVITAIDSVVANAKKARIPVFTVIPPNAAKGALFDLGADYHEVGRLVGVMAGKILNGEDPATLPVENILPETLVINPAALEGLKDPWSVPPEVLKSANRIIGQETAAAPGAGKKAGVRKKLWSLEIVTYVDSPATEEAVHGVLEGLEKSGLKEGTDYKTNVRNAQGDIGVLNALMDSSASKADMVIPVTTPALQAALNKVRGIPIVFAQVADPKAAGAVDAKGFQLPHVTGIYLMSPFEEMVALLKEYFPKVKRIGTLFVPAEVNSVLYKERFTQAAEKAGLELVTMPGNTSAEVADAAIALTGERIQAFIQISDSLSSTSFVSIANAAKRAKIPLFTFNGTQITQGALLTCARDFHEGGVEAGGLAARVIQGELPGQIAFMPVRRMELRLNLKAAAEQKFVFPEALIGKADKVIR